MLVNVIGVSEAAKILGLAEGTVKNYCAEGNLPAKKIGKTWVLDKKILKEQIKMKKIHEQLLKVVDEKGLSENGHYLSFYNSVDQLKEEVEFGDFGEWFEGKFSVPVDEVGGSFITFDSDSASDGYIYTDTKTAYDDIIWFLKNESRYKKYVNREKV